MTTPPPSPVQPPSRGRPDGPHSRACGWRPHDHELRAAAADAMSIMRIVTPADRRRTDRLAAALAAVSPEPGHDGHTHDVGPVRVWRCRTEGAGALKPTCTPDNPHDDRCSWVDAVPSPEPERRWECNKPGWMGACSPQSTHHNGFDWGCGWNAATPEPERDES